MDVLETIKKAAPIGAIAGVISVLVFWLLGKLSITAITIPFSTAGLDIRREPAGLALAQKIFGPLGINFSQADLTGSLIAAALAGAVFVSVGLLAYNALNISAKDTQMKLFYVLLIAAIVSGMLVTLKFPEVKFWPIFLLAANAYLSSWILDKLGMKV